MFRSISLWISGYLFAKGPHRFAFHRPWQSDLAPKGSPGNSGRYPSVPNFLRHWTNSHHFHHFPPPGGSMSQICSTCCRWFCFIKVPEASVWFTEPKKIATFDSQRISEGFCICFNTSPGLIWVRHFRGGPDFHLTRLTSSHDRVDIVTFHNPLRQREANFGESQAKSPAEFFLITRNHEKSMGYIRYIIITFVAVYDISVIFLIYRVYINPKMMKNYRISPWISGHPTAESDQKSHSDWPDSRPLGVSSSSRSCHTWSKRRVGKIHPQNCRETCHMDPYYGQKGQEKGQNIRIRPDSALIFPTFNILQHPSTSMNA